MHKFFSIIVPAYNVENYIENTINSILNQNFTDFEVILINDGSTDDTGDICQRLYENNLSRIVFVDCEHCGVSTARNEGLKRASGEYVMFVDGDDYLADGALSYLHHILTLEAPDLLCFDFIRTNSMNDSAAIDFDLSCSRISVYDAITWKLGEKTIPCYGACIRNNIIKKNAITFDVDLSYVEDALFLFRCMLACENILRNDNVLYFYLQRTGSATHLSYVPTCVSGMELRAWKRIKHLIEFDSGLVEIVNDRMKPIRECFYRQRIKELLHMPCVLG